MSLATSSAGAKKTSEQLAIDTIRTLSMDAVQKANSGHPGTPMALAPVAYTVWNEFLNYNPEAPFWPGRDRFILSCGHASMLLYSVLHLVGVRKVDRHGKEHEGLAVTLDNIKNFRQLGSPCAGHPEYGDAAGIETTTGPLGQGVGNSVGMAIAGQWFAARYNKPGYDLFGFDVYALCSDGDLMEGVANEAASIAGHLKLSNLCWIYDDNKITIEGETELAFSENVGHRFEGLGWHVLHVNDANDLVSLRAALQSFKKCQDKPTLIVLKSVIGYGSPNKANTHGAHGAPLGEAEIKLTKAAYGWPENEQFLVPAEAREQFASGIGKRGNASHSAWKSKFAEYKTKYSNEAAELEAIWSKKLPANWQAAMPQFAADAKGLATRVSSGKVLNAFAPAVPWLMGGSADLAPSTMTLLEQAEAGHFSAHNYAGRNMHFGIREHGMAAALNGMALAGLRSYGATFFVFTDYMRASMRLSSIMHLPVIYVLTHDSIGLGEDGPTHQPVEHLAACRAIPGLHVVRPSDANEVAEVYKAALAMTDHPVAMVLSRQNVATLDRSKMGAASGAAKGAYILSEADGGKPEVVLLSTGTEVEICLKAQQLLAGEGVRARVVSVPCMEWFDAQDAAYQESVLPSGVKRVAVEAGIRQCWDRYLGFDGRFVGMSSFGASAPFGTLYKHFGITPENVASECKKALGK